MSPGGCAVIRSGTVIGAESGRPGVGDVVICQGVVRDRCPHDDERVPVDASGCLVGPGLVDVHVHGALGHDFTEPDAAAWQAILGAHLSAGTTTALATLASAAPTVTAAALGTAAALLADQGAPTLAGVHLEGPCITAAQRGAHDTGALRSPVELLHELTPLPAALRMVTLAPELAGADELISHLSGNGVRVSVGHSSASAEVLERARGLGATHLAHLWSGQSALTRPDLVRIPGLLEASLASEGLSAEVIADGHHLPGSLLTIALRCFGPGRLCLVSDATAGTGLAVGRTFRVGASTGRVHDGYAATEDGASLCGSVLPLGSTLPRMRALTGAPVADVLTMATATPARTMGLYPRKGALLPGSDGDAVILTPGLEIRGVILAGRPVPALALGGVR